MQDELAADEHYLARNYNDNGTHCLEDGEVIEISHKKNKHHGRKKTIDDYLNNKSMVRRFSMIDDQIDNVL